MFEKILPLLALFVWMGIGNIPFQISEKVTHSEEEWLQILGEQRYRVMRLKGKEHAFMGQYVYTQTPGIYACAACDLPLFKSEDKYDSGSGWPSFKKPIEKKNVYFLEDWKMSFKRYEVLCSRCDSHLGHVFNDGPKPKGLRYCIQSIAIELK